MLSPLSYQKYHRNRYGFLSYYAKADLLVTVGKIEIHSPCSLLFYYFVPARVLRISRVCSLWHTAVHEHTNEGNYSKTKSSSRPSIANLTVTHLKSASCLLHYKLLHYFLLFDSGTRYNHTYFKIRHNGR